MYFIKLDSSNACFAAPHWEKSGLLFPFRGRSSLSHCEPAAFWRHKNTHEAVQMTHFERINHWKQQENNSLSNERPFCQSRSLTAAHLQLLLPFTCFVAVGWIKVEFMMSGAVFLLPLLYRCLNSPSKGIKLSLSVVVWRSYGLLKRLQRYGMRGLNSTKVLLDLLPLNL